MLKYVEERRESYLDTLMKMVSIKSYPCQEKEMAEFVLGELKKIDNLDDAFIDGAGNTVGILRGAGEGPNIVLNGHMDTVLAEDREAWAPYDPFKPVIDGEMMYGRGVADMKGGICAILYAFRAAAEYVKRTGKKLPGDLVFCGVVQEEPAEMFGIQYFMEETMKEKDIKCDLVLLAETTEGNVIIGQRGKIELVVKTYGKAVHSSTPKLGINALEMMDPILHAIFTHDGINLEPDPYLGETSITVTNCIVKPGGNLSTIPDECEIAVDRRYSTAMTEEQLLGEFEALFERLKKDYPELKATVEPRYFEETSYTGLTRKVKKWHPAWRVERDNPYVEKTFKALEGVGQHPKEAYFVGGTDGSMTCAIHGIPTIIYNAADGALSHQVKECAKVEDLVKSFEGYIAILCEMYGMELEAFR